MQSSGAFIKVFVSKGIKQLGVSFGPIFLLFSSESSWGPHSW